MKRFIFCFGLTLIVLVTSVKAVTEDEIHSKIADAIQDIDYEKAAQLCSGFKELGFDAAGIRALQAALASIDANNENTYLSNVKSVIDSPFMGIDEKSRLIDIACNAPVERSKYGWMKDAVNLTYNSDVIYGKSGGFIILAGFNASLNLGGDTSYDVARLMQSSSSVYPNRSLIAKLMVYSLIDLSLKQDFDKSGLNRLIDLCLGDEEIMKSEEAPVVFYAITVRQVKEGNMDEATQTLNMVAETYRGLTETENAVFFSGSYAEDLLERGEQGPELKAFIELSFKRLIDYWPNNNNAKYAAWRLFENSVAAKSYAQTIGYGEFLLAHFRIDEQPACVLFPLAEAYSVTGLKDKAVENYQKFLLRSLRTDKRRRYVTEILSADPNFLTMNSSILTWLKGGCKRVNYRGKDCSCTVGPGCGSGSGCEDFPEISCLGLDGCYCVYPECKTTESYCYNSFYGCKNCSESTVPCSGTCSKAACFCKYEEATGWYCATGTTTQFMCGGTMTMGTCN